MSCLLTSDSNVGASLLHTLKGREMSLQCSPHGGTKNIAWVAAVCEKRCCSPLVCTLPQTEASGSLWPLRTLHWEKIHLHRPQVPLRSNLHFSRELAFPSHPLARSAMATVLVQSVRPGKHLGKEIRHRPPSLRAGGHCHQAARLLCPIGQGI